MSKGKVGLVEGIACKGLPRDIAELPEGSSCGNIPFPPYYKVWLKPDPTVQSTGVPVNVDRGNDGAMGRLKA